MEVLILKISDVESLTGEVYDVVHKPKHYCDGGIQPIEYIRSHKMNFFRGNVIKYVTRAGKKDNEIEDLYKAMEYLKLEIEYLEFVKNGGSIS